MNLWELTFFREYPTKVYVWKRKKQEIKNMNLWILTEESKIINIEGEMYQNAEAGIAQLEGFNAFEELYISKYYPQFDIIRTVVLYGSQDTKNPIGKISFILTTDGKILISTDAPKLFHKAFKNIFDYWRV